MTTTNTKIDFAIITALPKELKAVLDKLGPYKMLANEFEPLSFYQGRIGNAEVVVTRLSEAGNIRSAIAATIVLERYHPDYLLMVGISAGFQAKKVKLGEVVVAKTCYYDGPGKETPDGTLPAPQQHDTSKFLCGRSGDYQNTDWKSHIRAQSPTHGFQPRVHHGVIASSERVIGDGEKMADFLDKHREFRAVAMEGYGVAEAVAHCKEKVHFLEIRGVCDFGTEDKNDKWHDYAAEVAAAYAVNLLRYIAETYRSPQQPKLKTKTFTKGNRYDNFQ